MHALLICFAIVAHLLHKLAPGVVVLGTPKAALLGLVAAKICGFRHRILILHGLRSETATSFAKFLLGFFESVSSFVATEIISVSHSLRQKYIENGHASPTKVRVLGRGSATGVEIERPRSVRNAGQRKKIRARTHFELGLDPSKITFAYVGRITRDKGISFLIEALKVLELQGHSIQFLFVGENEDRHFLEVLTSHDSWRLVPWTANIHLIYASIDAICLPSLREGMPTVVLEAAAAGLPTIGARSTGIVDLIDHERTGLLVEPRDSESLASAILMLAQDPKLRENLGRNAWHYVARHFTQDQVLSRYHLFLEGLVTGSTRKANAQRSTN